MFQKQKNQKSLILELDYEIESKSIKSSTKMTEQKIISKFVDLYEEVLVQIKGSQNLVSHISLFQYLINKMANCKNGDVFNLDLLLSNFKYLITLLIQELVLFIPIQIQYQMQVDSQNIEPNKPNYHELNQMKLDLQRFKYVTLLLKIKDKTDLQYRVKELEQDLHQQQQLNASICQDLLEARQKYQELQQKFDRQTQIKYDKTFYTQYDQNIKEKLKQLHTIYKIDKSQKAKSIVNQRQKLTIMTEPCDSDSYHDRFGDMTEKSNSFYGRISNKNKQNQTIETITSVGTDYNNVSDSFSCLLNNSFYNKRDKSASLSIDQSLEHYKNLKHVFKQGLPINNSIKCKKQTQFS
ncbi:unnamed protein product (macronuclear) [Paramecium tetraurelia]|uniref:Uncharacterized protein n=1 Tax=Paramecium tetraurelia TaxID=5888 RepID=A0DCG1_PARTE|nr:uncharacterized protein GSPATT00015606001 [Paramecium tetraurelia]CAK80728.1 unnamed protein product [Paramecium tetraurelia]|eukprot:XP_001448125.1 hypothetical protein (macronuclear) [Paramecium tetraurelia strain d4-2]